MSINLNAVNVNYESNIYYENVNNVEDVNISEKLSTKEKHLNAVNNYEQKNIPKYLTHIPSNIELTSMEKRLMEDLYDEKELFLKTSYPHSQQTLITAIKVIDKLIDDPAKNIKNLSLLSKYIESLYRRINTSAPSWNAANTIASKSLQKIGNYLSQTYKSLPQLSSEPNKDLLKLTECWVAATTEMSRKNGTGNNLIINYSDIDTILRYYVLNQEKLLKNYDFSVNLGRILNLLCYIRPGTLDSQLLSKNKEIIESTLFKTISQSLEIVDEKKDTFPLYHLRCSMNTLAHIINVENINNPNTWTLTRDKIDSNLQSILKNYKDLPAKNDLREEISVVLAKYLEDTGRSIEKNNGSNFYNFLKPIREEEIIPHSFQLNSGHKVISSYNFNNEERNKLNIVADKVLNNFHNIFGKNKIKDDYSKSLEIIIVKNKELYNRYGNYPFRIDTNNGGIYIEGNPKDPNNQPRVFIYMKGNDVHNFGHEIVHYLDGKYNKYGDAAEFSSEEISWWSEGLAEYLSHGEKNKYANQTLMYCSVNRRPTLDQIIDIDSFSANGHSERLYVWPYFVHKFLDSSPQLRSVRSELVRALRQPIQLESNNLSYSKLLNKFGHQYKEEFNHWLDQQVNYLRSINRNSHFRRYG
ncbi:MAG TPA: collagenase [Arsenophonus nasoniae]|uniref:collagenase n=1 Tax=Arsenophonus nasoniae TaxID=638 RepID=UPI0038794DD1